MRVFVGLLLCVCVLALPSHGVVNHEHRLEIDFTNAKTAAEKATWSDILTITGRGLGSPDGSTRFRGDWFQTKMIALGEAWRPTWYASFCVSIQPEPPDKETTGGLKIQQSIGDLFVRYSPDAMHWSGWQALQRGCSDHCPKNIDANFHGIFMIPRIEREEYLKRYRVYMHRDVPWSIDQEAAVEWIIENEPDFFTKYLPIMGYVEFRFESSRLDSHRIKSFNAVISYSLSGLFTPSKEPDYMKKMARPWSYKAKEPPQKEEK